MAVRRQQADDPHAWRHAGVGGVDNAGRRFSPFDQGEGGAHVGHGGQPVGDGIPNSKIYERLAGVDAGRYMVGIADGQAAIAQGAGKGEGRCGVRRRWRGVGDDENQAVAQEINAAGRHDGFLAGQEIHPLAVGRDEDIGRRPVGDLLSQGRTAGEGGAHGS